MATTSFHAQSRISFKNEMQPSGSASRLYSPSTIFLYKNIYRQLQFVVLINIPFLIVGYSMTFSEIAQGASLRIPYG
jgi:hypothetical protein